MTESHIRNTNHSWYEKRTATWQEYMEKKFSKNWKSRWNVCEDSFAKRGLWFELDPSGKFPKMSLNWSPPVSSGFLLL